MNTIHLIGAGAVGLLFAHHLAKPGLGRVCLIPRAMPEGQRPLQPVPVLYRRLGVETPPETSTCYWDDGKSPISTLLVCTKAYDGHNALRQIKDRLDGKSIVVLLSNGVLKMHQEIHGIWSDAVEKRPTMLLGLTTNGAVRMDGYSVLHTGRGETALGLPSSDTSPRRSLSQLQDILHRAWAGPLGYRWLAPQELHERLLRKLAVNACLNPLAALLGCANGRLQSPDVHLVLSDLCREFCAIFPEANADAEQLLQTVLTVARNTSQNRNSMEVDVSLGRQTEIDYITGHLVEQAQRVGVPVPRNDLLWRLLLIKSKL
ncbi:hypothetical protein HDV03_001359 [Kappamyces sp. JEL0829]|nr:hypothetical protein HDV03_001359 [Kappamyces sp. JEL0829]